MDVTPMPQTLQKVAGLNSAKDAPVATSAFAYGLLVMPASIAGVPAFANGFAQNAGGFAIILVFGVLLLIFTILARLLLAVARWLGIGDAGTALSLYAPEAHQKANRTFVRVVQNVALACILIGVLGLVAAAF